MISLKLFYTIYKITLRSIGWFNYLELIWNFILKNEFYIIIFYKNVLKINIISSNKKKCL